ncbi:kinesin-domain-containing protein [Fistulina hepatica ATCC 64428]|nr:kinesin-domain-containing protein [Fistulina hepatica ATCC 64428]
MAKPMTSSTRSTDDKDESPGSHIKVVIRCRRRSEREIQDGSPIIVSSNGAKSQHVSIETSPPASSLGVVSLPPTREYPFDLVFGPEADQAMVYEEVASPMLDEVVMGYNCTLFAYGQTGTGKTYTMQGDLAPTPMGNPSGHAGMIPRVLFRLFAYLKTKGCDFSVKVSFIELYNEELRDLLASDLSPPSGSMQPMGAGTTAGVKGDAGGLKIFDDSKRGTYIQGLEEVAVKDWKEALSLLTKGSNRRQVAATRFNDHSSRSHSVFSLTVHIKEEASLGDDLLKVGKLNLVDLAGSENVGRSGAENKRAREAGMINQSLLTLGRVINALVDKAQHVPYRESKLTRLLQDSLGGRTKTSLIATISPARSNIEETLATLDYALRAKSIFNKPEINQRMSRNALLKEYIGEIERLKADLLAAREKSGIFFSEDTWIEMTREKELRETELQEAKKQVEIVECQLRNVREEYDQSIGMLMMREEELKDTRKQLGDTEKQLRFKEDELEATRSSLEEEIVVREAHQKTEDTLNGVALGLKRVAQKSVNDVARLFEKIDRKSTVLSSNNLALRTHGDALKISRDALSGKLDEFICISARSTRKIQAGANQFKSEQLEILSAQSARVDEQLKRLQVALDSIRGRDLEENHALQSAQETLQKGFETLQTGFGTWADDITVSCQTLHQELDTSFVRALEALETVFKNMAALFEGMVNDAMVYVEAERQSVLQVKSLAEKASGEEIARLTAQNEMLKEMVEQERVAGQKAKDELLQRVSGLIGDFVNERDQCLRNAVGQAVKSNRQAVADAKEFGTGHGKVMSSMEAHALSMDSIVQQRRVEGKRTWDAAMKDIADTRDVVSHGTKSIYETFTGGLTIQSREVDKNVKVTVASSSEAFERHDRAKRARLETTDTLGAEVLSGYRQFQQTAASTSRQIETTTSTIQTEAASLAGATDKYRSSATGHLSSMQREMSSLASSVKEDIETGTTPRKHTWNYVDTWKLTRNRQELLSDWHRKPSRPARSDTAHEDAFTAGSETITEDHSPPVVDERESENTPVRNPTVAMRGETPSPVDTPLSQSDVELSSTSTSLTSSASTDCERPPAPIVTRRLTHKRSTSKSSLTAFADSKNVYNSRKRVR